MLGWYKRSCLVRWPIHRAVSVLSMSSVVRSGHKQKGTFWKLGWCWQRQSSFYASDAPTYRFLCPIDGASPRVQRTLGDLARAKSRDNGCNPSTSSCTYGLAGSTTGNGLKGSRKPLKWTPRPEVIIVNKATRSLTVKQQCCYCEGVPLTRLRRSAVTVRSETSSTAGSYSDSHHFLRSNHALDDPKPRKSDVRYKRRIVPVRSRSMIVLDKADMDLSRRDTSTDTGFFEAFLDSPVSKSRHHVSNSTIRQADLDKNTTRKDLEGRGRVYGSHVKTMRNIQMVLEHFHNPDSSHVRIDTLAVL